MSGKGSGRSDHSGQFGNPLCYSAPQSSLEGHGQITLQGLPYNDDSGKGARASQVKEETTTTMKQPKRQGYET